MVDEVMIPLINPNEPEALLVDLKVKNGQRVNSGDLLCILETTKSTFEIIASQAGYIAGIRDQVGDIVIAGEVFAYIAASPDWRPEESMQRKPVVVSADVIPEGLRISVPALTLAREKNIDLAELPKGIFVTREMVQAKVDSSWEEVNKIEDDQIDPDAIIIYGAGGHGKSVLDFVQSIGHYRVVGFIDDGLPEGESVLGFPVLGDFSVLPRLIQEGIGLAVNAVGGIGNLGIRENVFNSLNKAGFRCPVLIHPTAFVESSATLSAGTLVFPFAYIGSDASVGFGGIINTGAIISHECRLGDLVNISPNAILAGEVEVEDRVLIGMGVTINLSVKVGAGARVGNGATVKSDVPQRFVVSAGTIYPS